MDAKKKKALSRILAWIILVAVVVAICLTFPRTPWWCYLDVFFAFMMAFCNLLSVYMDRLPGISRQLGVCSLVFLVLMIVALIGEYIALN